MIRSFLRHDYYHKRIIETYKFLLPAGKKVLFYGSFHRKELGILKRSSKLTFVDSDSETFIPSTKFDYIILSGALGKAHDIPGLLGRIRSLCTPSTRILVYQHNFLWQWILNGAENLGLKRKEGIFNWLSVSDVATYLESAGFQITRVFRRTLSPLHFLGLGDLINFIGVVFPFFDILKLDQFIIARPNQSKPTGKVTDSLTVCITVRNEKGNIENIVKSILPVCKKQEILFVEGHSTDGTREEVVRVAKRYPAKNVRVIGQPGIGQGDAIRAGFKAARGEIIVLYEGDGTSDPGDVQYFYESVREGRFEFVEGSRFVYPLSLESMPLINQIGNIIFAKWFSFFLGQRTTDVLSGIKAVRKLDFEEIFEKWGFLGFSDPFGDFELLYGAARIGLKIGEIPMHYFPRPYGESKTRRFIQGLYLFRMAVGGYLIFRGIKV